MESINWELVGNIVGAILIGVTLYLRWKAANSAEKAKMQKDLADQAINVIVHHIQEGVEDKASAQNVVVAIKKSPIKSAEVEEYLNPIVKTIKAKLKSERTHN